MGKCVVHMQKIKASGVRGIQSHMNREHESKTNMDIDYERTKDNWHIWQNDDMYSFIRHQIKMNAPLTKTVRKDAVLLCNFIITSDEQTMKAMSPQQLKQFFKDSEEFFSRRYGCENIVFATVHMDETTPHLHLGIVPIQNEKLCAKDMFNPKELKSLQTDFAKLVGAKYELERGVEDSKAKHLSEIDYKIKMAEEKLEKMEQELPVLREQVSELQNELEVMDRAVKKKDDEGQALYGSEWKQRVANLKEQDKKERRASLLERFIELPVVKPLWDAFIHEQMRGRSKRREHIKE